MREVIVWGTGIHSEKCMQKYGERIKIIAFIDNYKKQEKFHEIDVYTWKEIKQRLKGYYILIASSEEAFWEIKELLDKDGLGEFEEYCYYQIYEKKIAIIYGNCHIIPIKEYLQKTKSFNKLYGFYPIRLIQEIATAQGEDFKSKVFKECDLLIIQDIQLNNKYGKEYSEFYMKKRVKKNCEIITMPNLYGLPKGMFPQLIRNKNTFAVCDDIMVGFRDCYIEELIAKNKSNEDIYNYIKGANIYEDRSDGYDFWGEGLNKFEKRERNCSFKATEFIADNIEHIQLFYDVNHPTNYVGEYYAKQILKILYLAENEKPVYIHYKLDAYEMPVYGAVMKHFGMKWNNKYEMRKYTQNSHLKKALSLSNYINEYRIYYEKRNKN